MPSTDKGQLLVAFIPVLIGMYATFVGLGILGKKPDVNPTVATRLRRQRRTLCILGPGAIAFGLYIAFSSRPRPEPTWQRCASEDGVCSAEFPGRPEKEVQTVGKATYRGLALKDEQQNALYQLSCADLSEPEAPDTVERQLDSARDVLVLWSQKSDSALHLVAERRIAQDDVPGRELEFTTSRDEVAWIRFFVKGRRLYRLVAAASKDKNDADIRRFLDSVRFEGKGR